MGDSSRQRIEEKMTHLTIETVECPGCGHTHRIEVDTEKAMKEAKEKFFKKHEGCVKK